MSLELSLSDNLTKIAPVSVVRSKLSLATVYSVYTVATHNSVVYVATVAAICLAVAATSAPS